MTTIKKNTEELNKKINELEERFSNLLELTISNMLKIEALIELQLENGIISKDKLMDKLKGRDREMKEKGGR